MNLILDGLRRQDEAWKAVEKGLEQGGSDTDLAETRREGRGSWQGRGRRIFWGEVGAISTEALCCGSRERFTAPHRGSI